MGGMSERDEKRGGPGCAIGCLLMLLIAPVLYVLSLGPAVWIAGRSPAAESIFVVIYCPLRILSHYSQPISDALDWYIGFWE